MKKWLRRKEATLSQQLGMIFITIGVVVGGIMLLALGLNYGMMEKQVTYLEYVGHVSQLVELSESAKVGLNQLLQEGNTYEWQEIEKIREEADVLLETMGTQTTSTDIRIRIRVVDYLFGQYATKSKLLLEMVEEGAHLSEEGDVARTWHMAYVAVMDVLSRIDVYQQEIMQFVVAENKAFLEKSLIRSKQLPYMFGSIVVSVLVVAIYFGHRYSRYLEKMIKEIVSLTGRIALGYQMEQLTLKDGPKEFRQLTLSCNQLILTMEKLRQEVAEKGQLELKLAEAQLQGLQLQIQPHFLFNTLNSIAMLALLENNQKVYNLIGALSRFMRYSLRKATALVPIREEVEMVKQYLYILQARMGERLSYTVSNLVKETIPIPLFTLQPIVENAFRHGLEEKIGNGNIIVSIKEQRSFLVLRVYNDGIAMKKEELEALRKSCNNATVQMNQEHIGVTNVACRLNLLFKDAVTYAIYSREPKGTLFVIKIKIEEVPDDPLITSRG